MLFSQGESVGPYTILEQLGQGGMATVYKAYHPALERYVAIKVLHPAFTQDPAFLNRFRREAKLVARLEHPNIVPVYDFAEHQGKPYLVMKYIPGKTLKARLAESPLTAQEGMRIVVAVGAALSHAHAGGILHRDLKPSNVLLSDEGPVYLADFGLARIAASGESTLSSDMLMGTPQYISPEQARGDKNLDAGTDIYSFGVLLYEMVVGRVPFNADTPYSVIHDHIFTPLPPPSVLNPKVPQAVERVLLRALAKARGDRYPTIDAMVRAFRSAVSGRPEEAAATAALERDVAVTAVQPALASKATSAPAEGSAGVIGEVEGAFVLPVKKARRRWILAVAALMVLCLCVALALVLSAGEDRTSMTPSPAGVLETASVPPLPAIDSAFATVQANDHDPEAHRRLAEALVASDRKREAVKELERAAELYMAQGQHLRAATVLLEALRFSGATASSNPELLDRMTQALFLGAADPGAAEVMAAAQKAYPRREELQIFEARARLLGGETGKAEALLEPVLGSNPESPLAQAVMVEIHISRAEYGRAAELAGELLGRPGLPEWLTAHLTLLQQSIPTQQ